MKGKRTTNDKTRQHGARQRDERHDVQCASDAEQRELWERYLEQQARRACPGCGEPGKAVL